MQLRRLSTPVTSLGWPGELRSAGLLSPAPTIEGRMIEHVPLYLLPKPDPGPYPAGRLCDTCSALLNRSNPGPTCLPCQRKVVELHPDDAA